MRRLVGSFDDHARFVIRARPSSPRRTRYFVAMGIAGVTLGVVLGPSAGFGALLMGVLGGMLGRAAGRTALVELDRSRFVITSEGRERFAAPTTTLAGFRAGTWTPSALHDDVFEPQWTVEAVLDDGRAVSFELALRDEADARAWATTLERALARIRTPQTYRG